MRRLELEDCKPIDDEIMLNPDARAAAIENDLRRKIAKVVLKAMERKGFPKFYFYRELGIPQSQALRLIQKEGEVGGDLSLFYICKAADKLDLEVSISLKPKRRDKIV